MRQKCLAVTCILLSGCSPLGLSQTACTDAITPGFRLFLENATDDVGVVSPQIIAVASSFQHTDTAQTSNSDPDVVPELLLVEDVEGVYDVSVEAAGFEGWQSSNRPVVAADECHVRSDTVRIQMQPLPRP